MMFFAGHTPFPDTLNATDIDSQSKILRWRLISLPCDCENQQENGPRLGGGGIGISRILLQGLMSRVQTDTTQVNTMGTLNLDKRH